ncbi:hypothetical protein OB920_04975 [Halobacteria archaeon HArc-gm2]|nr:hypothetical protein [Halobacteria archaeon HArc-gm2]
MTIIRAPDDHRNANIRTTGCSLCGLPLREQQGASDHLPNCAARSAYAPFGALRDGGPSPEEVQEAIRTTIAPSSEIAADGGLAKCDRCHEVVTPDKLKVYLQPDGNHENLCPECQTKVPNARLYRPSNGGEQA